ncbi:MAG: phosphotriesterase-related protein [Chloroflexi bacterium]|nr:phosphotriesterase-related protein [Chloroflexota bacterium]
MSTGHVMTVAGPADPGSLGFTLPHEHLYINQWHIPERFDYPLLTDDDDILADEIGRFAAAGGRTIVECTTPDAGRQPARLRAIAERTGLMVVMACGWYRAPYYRPEDRIERRSVRDLTAGLIHEIREGETESGFRLRPGLIGEIGAEKGWVSPIEERTHRAAGQAAAATGLPLLTHSVYGDVGLEQLTLFELEGADPGRVAIGHADTTLDLGYLLAILGRGALVMFDSFMDMRGRQEERAISLVRELVDRGFVHRILLSLDVCRTSHLTFGGGGGFGYLATTVVPRLRAAGVDEAAIHALTVTNPARWLTIGGG